MASQMYKANKQDLRRSLLHQRQSLSSQVWRTQSDRLCAHLQAWEGFRQSRTILAYFSIRQEIDLSPLWTMAGVRWGMPRCVGRSLVWHQWHPSEGVGRGAYGIPEPLPDAPLIEPDSVDLILVPSVACDRQGYRLGYGGGFYDRMLSSPEWATKPTLGIVFEAAYLPQLPVDPWDRPLQGVCTEAGIVLGRGIIA